MEGNRPEEPAQTPNEQDPAPEMPSPYREALLRMPQEEKEEPSQTPPETPYLDALMRTPPEQQEDPGQSPSQQDPVAPDISSPYRDALLRPPPEEQTEEPWMVPVRIGKLRKLRFKRIVDVSESFPVLEGQHLRREPFRAVCQKMPVARRTVRRKQSSRERDSTRDREDLTVGKVSMNFTDRPSTPEPSERRESPTAARGMASTEPAKTHPT